jgi:hypothetical protein
VRERAQLAGLDLLHDRRRPARERVDLAAEQRDDRGPAPVYGMCVMRKPASAFSISIGTCIVP